MSTASSSADLPASRRERRERAERRQPSGNDLDALFGSSSGDGGDSGKPVKRRRIGRWIGLGIVVFVVLLLVAAVWVAFRAMTVKNELEASQRIVADVQQGADMQQSLESLGGHASKAADAAGDPVWVAMEIIPFIGDNLRGVRLTAQSLDALSNRLGSPALAAVNGGGDEPLLTRVLPVIDKASPEIVKLSDEITAVAESDSLIGPVRSGVDQTAEVMATAGPALEFLPSLLGADGPRNYLLVFQNNAESVGLGGSAASQTLMHVDGADVTIAGQASSTDYRNGTAVDVQVDESALALYSDYLISYINTSASRPDFPTMAEVTKAFWQRDIGEDEIDGVISIDPIALSRVVGATGGIELDTGDTLTAENAVSLLLNEVYFRYDISSRADNDLVDKFFQDTASTVFSRVTTGDFDLQKMMKAVGDGITQGNIMFWSADDEEQRRLEEYQLAGVLPTDNEDSTTVGVFFRDESASKIDYYMRSAIQLSQTCQDGQRTVSSTSSLHLDLDQDFADELPAYVKSGTWGSEEFRTQVYVYGPPGMALESVDVDGREVELVRDDVQDLGRPVAWFTTQLKPGEAATVTATFRGDDGEAGPLQLRSTPMVNATDVAIDDQCR